MVKQVVIPFAEDGDRSEIPDVVNLDGFVSYPQGYSFDYSRVPGSSPLAKNVERLGMNGLFNDVTGAIKDLQDNGAPTWFPGTNYGEFVRVHHEGNFWRSAVASNVSTPGENADWVIDNTSASSTFNNLTATTNPTVTDDSTDGYGPLSTWINVTASEVFTCITAAPGAAVWVKGTLTVDELGNVALLTAATVGQNLIQMPNPSAIRFIRINADNSVSLLDAAAFLTAIGGGSGLTNFTEAKNVTAPNATVPVVSLSATSSETDVDFMFTPKGAGALLATVPDNTSTGGNKRGTYAVDLQRTRTAADKVASGSYAIVMGNNNVASGTGSIAIGRGSSALATDAQVFGRDNTTTAAAMNSFTGGYLNNVSGGSACVTLGSSNTVAGSGNVALGTSHSITATASYSAAMGRQNTVGCPYTFLFGQENTAINSVSITHSAAFGWQNQVDGSYSFVTGARGWDRGAPSQVYSSGSHAATAVGTAQVRQMVLRASATGATPIVMVAAASGTAAAAGNSLILPDNSAFFVTGKVVARDFSNNVKSFDFTALLARDAGAATTVVVGTATVTSTYATAGAAAWSIGITANTTLGGLTVTATGAVGANSRWVCEVTSIETAMA